MKAKKVIAIVAVSIFSMLSSISAFAGYDNWNYTDNTTNYGSYVPKTGDMTTSFSSVVPEAYTNVTFTFDSDNVAAITSYNNGTNPSYQGVKGYVTVDISNIRTGSVDTMDAYTIVSNLPNPKYDLENDDLFGSRNEESEVVALGTVGANEYYVITAWNDLRKGNSTDNGRWQCQFSMSSKGLVDYNTFVQSSAIQATVYYGNTFGED